MLVADDNPVVRIGLRAVLARHPALEIVGEVADGPAALRLTDSRTSATGVTMQTYDAAGEPTFGTVGA